jgi:predicted HicB family RNase H-like nuclease
MPESIATTKQGTPITEELAREAEDVDDLTRAQPVGRPSLAGSSGTSPRLSFRVTRDLYDNATQRAQREGKTLSELARDALEHYVR